MKSALRQSLFFAALSLLTLWLPATPSASAQADLSAEVSRLIREANLGNEIAVAVSNAESGAVIHETRGDLPLNPASNMKLLTAAAALAQLGPNFTIRTGLYGRISSEGNVSNLVMRGYGDPSLRMSDLVQMASSLRHRGVSRVRRVTVDGSYFDGEILPPLFEQQPGETAAFRAAIGAVAVERASFVLRVMPGSEVGQPARVLLSAGGYFDLDNAITTSEGGEPRVVAIQRGDGPQMSLRVRGSVPFGTLGVSYRRRIENPLYHAGHSMVSALRNVRIRPEGHVRVQTVSESLPLLASRRSPPMSELIHALGKSSDNFTAEMLLKILGAERSRPGTSAGGAEAIRDLLREASVDVSQVSIQNGSGLFTGNEVAANHFIALLNHIYRQPGLRSEYLAHLAIGGTDGTLRRRLRDLPAPYIVRAKTGTLNDVIALSGYVLAPTSQRTVSFSILLNGIRGRQGAARRLADDIVRAIARHLYP